MRNKTVMYKTKTTALDIGLRTEILLYRCVRMAEGNILGDCVVRVHWTSVKKT